MDIAILDKTAREKVLLPTNVLFGVELKFEYDKSNLNKGFSSFAADTKRMTDLKIKGTCIWYDPEKEIYSKIKENLKNIGADIFEEADNFVCRINI